MRKFIIIFIGLALFGSCEKGFLSDCKFSSGEITTEQRTVGEFNNILLSDNVNLIIEESQVPGIVVEAGSNLLKGISTNVNANGTLELSNNNQCDWARDFSTPINVYLSCDNIDTIEYRSIGNISCTDTLHIDTLWIRVMEGAGSINITVDAVRLYSELHYGTADIIVGGKCRLSFVYSASFGLIDLRELTTSIVYVTNRSSNNVFVNSTNTLEAKISSIGDIYYKGNPVNIKIDKTGSGNLIKLPD